MSTKLTDSDGRVSTVDAFAAIVVNVMNEMNVSLDRLKELTKDGKPRRTPNGFPEALALALNDMELTDAGPAEWNASNVSKRYKKWQADGSLFPATERALRSEQSEQSEQVPENEGRSERSEPEDMSPEEEAWILSAGITSEHSERAEHGPDSTPGSEQSDRSEPFATETARSERYEPAEQEQPPRADDVRAERYEQDEPIVLQSPCSEQSERYEPHTLPDIPEHMKTALRAFAREVFEEMLHTVPNVQHAIDNDMPPKPEKLEATGKGGRRQVREYGKLSATVDSVLFELFRAECKERELSAGRLLDAILWNRYGRPELSYQREDAEQRARERPKRQSTSRSE